MTRIAYLSDVHSEFWKHHEGWLPALPEDVDILILGGDVGVGRGVINFIDRVAEALPSAYIVWVAGNHEFYHRNIDKSITEYRDHYKDNERVFFLENNAVTLCGVRFLGCTLWSDFSCLGEDFQSRAIEIARGSINDFVAIKCTEDDRVFTPEDAAKRYRESYAFLERELSAQRADFNVVVTHFAPSKKMIHPQFGENLLTPYFSSNCEPLMDKYQPVYWIYGHNHWTDKLSKKRTMIASNQLGYPSEYVPADTFNAEAIFEI